MIAQISQMHQQSQYIVLSLKRCHIIGKGSNVNLYGLSGKHSYNIIFQPFKIHANISFQSLICFRLIPVVIKNSAQHRIYHGFRTVHRILLQFSSLHGTQLISVIPCFCLFETSMILFAECLYFLFREAKKFCHFTRIRHGILRKHI